MIRSIAVFSRGGSMAFLFFFVFVFSSLLSYAGEIVIPWQGIYDTENKIMNYLIGHIKSNNIEQKESSGNDIQEVFKEIGTLRLTSKYFYDLLWQNQQFANLFIIKTFQQLSQLTISHKIYNERKYKSKRLLSTSSSLKYLIAPSLIKIGNDLISYSLGTSLFSNDVCSLNTVFLISVCTYFYEKLKNNTNEINNEINRYVDIIERENHEIEQRNQALSALKNKYNTIKIAMNKFGIPSFLYSIPLSPVSYLIYEVTKDPIHTPLGKISCREMTRVENLGIELCLVEVTIQAKNNLISDNPLIKLHCYFRNDFDQTDTNYSDENLAKFTIPIIEKLNLLSEENSTMTYEIHFSSRSTCDGRTSVVNQHRQKFALGLMDRLEERLQQEGKTNFAVKLNTIMLNPSFFSKICKEPASLFNQKIITAFKRYSQDPVTSPWLLNDNGV